MKFSPQFTEGTQHIPETNDATGAGLDLENMVARDGVEPPTPAFSGI